MTNATITITHQPSELEVFKFTGEVVYIDENRYIKMDGYGIRLKGTNTYLHMSDRVEGVKLPDTWSKRRVAKDIQQQGLCDNPEFIAI